MAWTKLIIQTKPASIGTGIKALLRGKKAAILTLNISRAEAVTIGLSDKDKVEVLLGDGPDHGLVRIRKNNSAGQATAEKREAAKGHYFLIKLGHQEMFVNRAEAAKWCQWEKVADGWFEIVLPKWADETRVKQPATQPPSAATAPKGPQERAKVFGNGITSRLMGDPDPSRSALAQKG
jgi:hypothetical protein